MRLGYASTKANSGNGNPNPYPGDPPLVVPSASHTTGTSDRIDAWLHSNLKRQRSSSPSAEAQDHHRPPLVSFAGRRSLHSLTLEQSTTESVLATDSPEQQDSTRLRVSVYPSL